MQWVTREKVKVDRVACPWLIRRFIDSDAEFVFLPHDTDWDRVEGIVYDVPGAELGHHGEGVSFDAILDKYNLKDPALPLLAKIVHTADSNPSHPHPAGQGLRWIAHGLRARLARSRDFRARIHCLDALFAECHHRALNACNQKAS